jgi:hypothetical protein
MHSNIQLESLSLGGAGGGHCLPLLNVIEEMNTWELILLVETIFRFKYWSPYPTPTQATPTHTHTLICYTINTIFSQIEWNTQSKKKHVNFTIKTSREFFLKGEALHGTLPD